MIVSWRPGQILSRESPRPRTCAREETSSLYLSTPPRRTGTSPLFSGLRVADVSDGMDKAGLPGVGLVDPAILPLWTDLKDFRHRFAGSL